jgi:hypothetical protein
VTGPARGYPAGTPDGPATTTTLHGTLHFFLGGLVVFTSLAAVCCVLARSFAGRPGWRGWPAYSVGTGVCIVVLFVLGNAGSLASPHLIGSVAGLIPRSALVVGLAWVAIVAWRLRSELGRR